jgi:hypothetical protein
LREPDTRFSYGITIGREEESSKGDGLNYLSMGKGRDLTKKRNGEMGKDRKGAMWYIEDTNKQIKAGTITCMVIAGKREISTQGQESSYLTLREHTFL